MGTIAYNRDNIASFTDNRGNIAYNRGTISYTLYIAQLLHWFFQ